ncbi:DNA-3-methyladenine glycosylase 2 family protein [Streptomyces sp. ISL-11]|uniref:DNA-3-methyladenine glycosylase 2 family protein n=1 Tax=Streptomyces sp. ISL-11 TaxID=2819174 RepID=UPI001BECD8DD|nr:AlkA N-terminal domain-containing protein [Streptomyces sp. ISL-11]MBT2382370.1 helix-turn-helix domain-containing protein [Streptomyces sp. ISL-11]
MTDTAAPPEDARYDAVRSRDARFDGHFFFAVVTTGIYCRPSCPAVTPKRPNVRFFPSAAAAQGAGFRACRRCRPDAVPGSAEWDVRADLVGRAMRLIGDGVIDRDGVAGLADRLGYSPRQVHRQLTQELGAGPVALARARRAHTARVLLQTTALPVTEIAFAAGFASVRQFNDTVREIYARTPSALRAEARGARTGGSAPTGVPLRLAHRGPYAAREIFDFLQRRAIAGIEEMTGAPGARRYRRTLRLPYGTGIAEVREPAAAGRRGRWLDCRLHLGDLRDLSTAVQRVRRLFDLDADPYAVAERLGTDPRLRPLTEARPGLRSPGTADGDELAVRAVLGQQVTVAAAARLAGTLVAAYGKPLAAPDGTLTHVFPEPATLAEAGLEELGMPQARRRALRALATALADGDVDLGPGVDRDATERALLALPGIGPWTAGYIRMRALGDPDVFLPGDAGVRHGLAALGAPPDAAAGWRPWRSYALHHLWNHTAKDD